MSVYIDGFAVDAFLSVDPSFKATVTSEPVESGGTVSDHIVNMPLTLSITGIVSDSPVGEIANERDEDVAPTVEGYNKLVEIHKTKKLVTITDYAFPAFTRMAMTSFTPNSTTTTGEAMPFRATFEQMTFGNVSDVAETTLVALPRQKRAKRKGHAAAEEKPEAKLPNVFESSNRGGAKGFFRDTLGL